MTEQKQQIALCEWAGWRIIMHEDGWRSPICPTTGNHIGFWSTEAEAKRHYPDTNSLDVLHEMAMKAVEALGVEFQCKFTHWMTEVAMRRREGSNVVQKLFWVSNAKAAQRREALLRTLGLWKE